MLSTTLCGFSKPEASDNVDISDLTGNWDDVDGIVGAGWIPAGETWTYASANTFTISGDLTGKYAPGQKIKLTQTTDKYFFVTKVAYSSPNTTITVYGGTEYTLATAAITDPYFSLAKSPFGFPQNPSSWTISTTDTTARSKASPVKDAILHTDLGSKSITIPIGVWRVTLKISPWIEESGWASANFIFALAPANNSLANAIIVVWGFAWGATGASLYKSVLLAVTTPTTYYLVGTISDDNIESISLYNDVVAMEITAEYAG